MSAPGEDRQSPAEAVAGFMAAAAMAASLTAIAYRPMRVAPFAIVIALVAAGIGGRHQRLAAVAVGVTTVAWFVGTVVAVVTENPLY